MSEEVATTDAKSIAKEHKRSFKGPLWLIRRYDLADLETALNNPPWLYRIEDVSMSPACASVLCIWRKS